MAKKNDEPEGESVFGKIGKDDPTAEQPPAEPPVVEYPKYVKRYDDAGNVTDDILVQTEDEEKAVKANWAKDDAKAKKAEKAEKDEK